MKKNFLIKLVLCAAIVLTGLAGSAYAQYKPTKLKDMPGDTKLPKVNVAGYYYPERVKEKDVKGLVKKLESSFKSMNKKFPVDEAGDYNLDVAVFYYTNKMTNTEGLQTKYVLVKLMDDKGKVLYEDNFYAMDYMFSWFPDVDDKIRKYIVDNVVEYSLTENKRSFKPVERKGIFHDFNAFADKVPDKMIETSAIGLLMGRGAKFDKNMLRAPDEIEWSIFEKAEVKSKSTKSKKRDRKKKGSDFL